MMGKNCIHKTVLILGIIELLLSVGIVSCGVANLIVRSSLFFVGHGIWGGAWLCLASIFAILAGYLKTIPLHVSHMILATLSCIIIVPSVSALFGIETGLDSDGPRYIRSQDCEGCYQSTYGLNFDAFAGCPSECHKPKHMALLFEVLGMSFVGGLFVFFVISASFTCCAVCSCCGTNINGAVSPKPQEAMVVYSYPMQQQQQLQQQNQEHQLQQQHQSTSMSTNMQQTYPAIGYNPNICVNPSHNVPVPEYHQNLPPPYGQPTFSAYLYGQNEEMMAPTKMNPELGV